MKEEHKGLTLSLAINDKTYTFHSDYADCSLVDVVSSFYGLLICATWQPQTIVDVIGEFVDEARESIGNE